MQNPIPKSNLFSTPSLAQIQDYISKLPEKQKAEAKNGNNKKKRAQKRRCKKIRIF